MLVGIHCLSNYKYKLSPGLSDVNLCSILNGLPLILHPTRKSIVGDLTFNLPLGDFKTASYPFSYVNHRLGLGVGDDQNGEGCDGGENAFVP